MISTSDISLRVGKRVLFEDVNTKSIEGNYHELIGANDAGKPTFLKVLLGQLEPTGGGAIVTPGQRLSFLQWDHFKYDQYTVLDTVIMGNKRLYEIMKEKKAIHMKEDFTNEDGIKTVELKGEFANMNGREVESDAESLLNGLGVELDLHYAQMSSLLGARKVKVLLAQVLFSNPDILLLDEPTNHLDLNAITWLEEFLVNFENTVIVVFHDRYFLNKVYTQMADTDYRKIQLYVGNYNFQVESSQLVIKQMEEASRKRGEKIKELQELIQRFSADASRSRWAASRKRVLEEIELDGIHPSSRRHPYVDFRPFHEIDSEVLTVEHLSKTIDSEKIPDDISFILGREDKAALMGPNKRARAVFFEILPGEMEPDGGSYKWGLTASQAYFPKDNSVEFGNDGTIIEWLTRYSPEKDVTYIHSFLERILLAGEDGVKRTKVLSGGEEVRCMLSRMMMSGANMLVLDGSTGHLDMESINVLNRGMIKFPGVTIFSSHDHQIVQIIANHIMEIINGKLVGKITTCDEYPESDKMARKRFTFILTESREVDDQYSGGDRAVGWIDPTPFQSLHSYRNEVYTKFLSEYYRAD